ncbi:MAG: flagellar hook-length control protein FliK [Clostridium sp.]|nr:flagellar hook-length control protein FliK [Clostridium sp.]
MAQVGKVNQLDLGNLIAPPDKTSSVKDSTFSDIMSSNMKNSKSKSQNNDRTDSVQTAKAKLEESNACTKKIEQCDTKDVTENVSENENQVLQEVNAENEISVDGKNEIIAAFTQELAKILGITDEELEKMMVESGLTVMDLFKPEVLQQLVLQANESSEITDLLTNETMCGQLQELLEFVEEFAVAVDMEQFKAVAIEEQDFSEVLAEEESDGTMEQPVEKTLVKEQVITVQKEVSTGDQKMDQRKESSAKDDGNQLSQFNQFVQNVSESVVGTGDITAESVEKMQQMQEIVNQVVERIKVTLSSESTVMEMQLNPENLGKVNVSVLSKNGEMTAAFTVESQIAKEALESQITTLKDNLQEQGIKVDAIEVTVAQHGFQDEFSRQNQQQFQNQKKHNNSSSRIRLHGEDNMEEVVEEEIVHASNSNGTVDFSA